MVIFESVPDIHYWTGLKIVLYVPNHTFSSYFTYSLLGVVPRHSGYLQASPEFKEHTWHLFESIGSVPDEIWRQENQAFQLRNELKVRNFWRYFQIHRFCKVTYVMCKLTSVRRNKIFWVSTSISRVQGTRLASFWKHWKCSRWNLASGKSSFSGKKWAQSQKFLMIFSNS